MLSNSIVFLCLSFVCFVLIKAEISSDSAKENKADFKVLEKDVDEAKERWMELEDWGDDDMMQHPIDEGPRRVNPFSHNAS